MAGGGGGGRTAVHFLFLKDIVVYFLVFDDVMIFVCSRSPLKFGDQLVVRRKESMAGKGRAIRSFGCGNSGTFSSRLIAFCNDPVRFVVEFRHRFTTWCQKKEKNIFTNEDSRKQENVKSIGWVHS
jgi:hypothetical protein